MRWTFRSLIVLAAWAPACSVLNSFDELGQIDSAGGSAGSSGQGGSGGASGGDGGSGGLAGTAAGKGGSGGTSAGTAGGGGDAGGGGEQPLVGTIVVGQRSGTGASARNEIVVLDPADGSEAARTETELQIHAIGYEAPRDVWFVFTGTAGPGGDADVLAGRMTRHGFVEEGRTTVPNGKPSGQSTMTVLNERILYRTVQSNGIDTSDKLILLNTSDLENLTIQGSVDLAPERRILATLGRPSPTAAGGRVTFIHFNPNSTECDDNDQVCPVKTSSMQILPAVTNPSQPPAATLVDWVAKSGSLPAGATDLKNGFDYIAVPPDPSEGSIAKIYKYDSTSTRQTEVEFDLGTLSTPTVSISAAVIDPCAERVVVSELATTRKIYAVSVSGTGVASVPLNAAAGGLVYEPYTKTVIQFLQDATNPSFRGFQLGGTAAAPTLTERGTSEALPWSPPANPPLNPSFVVVKSPLQPPCN
jgi:hypothetical protein